MIVSGEIYSLDLNNKQTPFALLMGLWKFKIESRVLKASKMNYKHRKLFRIVLKFSSTTRKQRLFVSKYTPNRITYILANAKFFIEDLMAAHNLVPTLQSTRFLEDRRQKSRNIDQGLQHSCNDKQWMERSQLPVASPVDESGSPQTTPPDTSNQGIPQPQRTMSMYPLRRT